MFCPLFRDSLPRTLHVIYSELELDCPIPLPPSKRSVPRPVQSHTTQPYAAQSHATSKTGQSHTTQPYTTQPHTTPSKTGQSRVLGPRRSGKEKKIVLTATKPRATEQAQMLSLQERLKKASTVVSFPTIDFRVVKHHVPKAKKR